MCHLPGLLFATANLSKEEISGRRVLEVGSLDVNGSVRPFLERMKPSEYVGVDLSEGKGVDRICRIEELEAEFGSESFDTVVATEVLEHVLDWRRAVSNLKRVCRSGGTLLLTTRSRGFKYHGYPYDFWRYETDDFRAIFSDFQIESLEPDPAAPGVFMKARRTADFSEKQLDGHALYSVLLKRKVGVVDPHELERISRRKSRSMRIRTKLVRLLEKILLLK